MKEQQDQPKQQAQQDPEKKAPQAGEPIRDARSLGVPKMLLLGLQHLFAMFGATILVPVLVQSYGLPLSIQTTLLFSGLGTLFFHLCTKFKVPVFLGSSFAFLGGFSTIARMDYGVYANLSGEEKLSYALGGIVIAGLVYLVVAALVQLVGVRRVMQFLPPVVTGPIIMVFGLSLAPTAITNASSNWLLAILAIVVIVEVNLWGEGMVKIVPVLMGILLPYIVALVTRQVDFSGVAQASWVGAPPIVMAKFDLTSILVMAPIAVASIVEHVGDVSAISSTVGENFLEDPGLHRTLIGDGVATAVAGLFGAPANTTYGENIGVLELTHVYDPRVVRIAAVYAILLSFSPKFAALVNTIPTSILGGVSFILYGMLAAIGVRHMVENRVDFTNPRNLIITAVILVSGVGFEAWGDGYQNVGMTFTIGNASITLPAVAIAAIAGIVLNIILPGRDYEFGSDITGGHSGSMGRY